MPVWPGAKNVASSSAHLPDQAKPFQVFETDLDGLQRGDVALILLNDNVLCSRFTHVREDSLPVNPALADRSERVNLFLGVFVGVDRHAFFDVLDVEQRKTSRVIAPVRV